MKYFIVITTLLFLNSCFQEENPIAIPDRGDVQVDSITFSIYDNQIYYSLEQGQVITSHENWDWSFGYDCRPDSHYVRINTGIGMKAIQISVSDLEEINSEDFVTPDTLFVDSAERFGDQTMAGKWWENEEQNYYYLNAGLSNRLIPLGIYSFTLELLSENSIKISYLKQNDGQMQEITLTKDPSVNFVYGKIGDTDQFSLEPNKNEWDIEFTSITEIVPTLDSLDLAQYQVRGVYLNPNNVEAGKIDNPFDSTFQAIVYNDIDFSAFSSKRNVIGYDWKDIDIDANTYTTNFNQFYMIKSVNGGVYKLRFTKFNNSKGIRGFPEIEFQRL